MPRRRSSVVSAGLLLTVALAAGHDGANATQSVTVIRHSGATRYATAAVVATATYQPAGDHVADNASAGGRGLNRRVEIELYRVLPVGMPGAPPVVQP